jgi:Neutral/alkaline non-lysosomal ceramidase, N-terminal
LQPSAHAYILDGMKKLHLAGCSVVSVGLAMSVAVPASAGEIKAGYAKTDVTPREPVELAGYDLRGAPSDGVWGDDKLYVRAVVFDDGSQRVAFVEGDVIIIRNADEYRRRIAAATGIPFENVLLGDVHNHAAPSPDALGKTKWEQEFSQALVATVQKAAGDLEPVRLAAGEGHSRIAMNRRQVLERDSDSVRTFDENARSQSFGKYKTDHPAEIHDFAGVVRLGANPTGAIDSAVDVVRIDSMDGKPLAAMIHYACHGTSLGGRNSKISGEWMGRMQAYLEKQVPGVGSIYLQGGAGDINPRVVGGLDGNKDNIEVTWALGEEIGREVVRVYQTLKPEPMTASLKVMNEDIRLPRAYRELFEDFHKTVVDAPTTVVRMGDLMWVTFPGEMFHAIAQHVKLACPAPHAFLMGYTNGYIGYFPEQKAFAEGGYEPAVSNLDPAAEGIYMRQIAELLSRFR